MADIRTTTKVEGSDARDAPQTQNPIVGGGRASAALPTAVSADGDVVEQWLNRSGAAVVALLPHIGLINSDPYLLVNKTAQYTSTQTGTALWTPSSGKKIVVTSYSIVTTGTTGGNMQLWFGASADTTYTRGTDFAIFDGNFIPSASISPGVVQSGLWIADAADRVLRVTDDAAINTLTVNVWGYEVT